MSCIVVWLVRILILFQDSVTFKSFLCCSFLFFLLRRVFLLNTATMQVSFKLIECVMFESGLIVHGTDFKWLEKSLKLLHAWIIVAFPLSKW